jgi:iron uptake system component EfeO
MQPIVRNFLLPALALGALAVAGCGSGSDAPAGAKKMAFELTDAGCDPHDAEAPAGPIVFDVENAGTSAVSEFEVLDGETILGEKENLADGLSGSFSLELEPGEYTLYCPGGSEERGTLTVSGGKAAAQSSPQDEAAISPYAISYQGPAHAGRHALR